MSSENMQAVVVWTILLSFLVFRFLRFRRVKVQIPRLISEGATVIDVRTEKEYAGGARPGSLNIPLYLVGQELDGRLKSLDKSKPVVVCCASGTRSAMAASTLRKAGFTQVFNAGPWRNTIT